MSLNRLIPCLFLALITSAASSAATVEVISAKNRHPLQGKEVDWIDGDFVLKNDVIVAVIAHPTPTRDANMTVRGVGAGLIDLTRLDVQSDQLSAFYPAGGRYSFTDGASVEHGQRDDGSVFWRCQSSSATAGDGTVCTVEYELRDGQPFLTCTVRIHGQDVSKLPAFDSVRADRTFQFKTLPGTDIAYCEDEHFRQTYGFQNVTGTTTPTWESGRSRRLTYADGATVSTDNTSTEWKTRIYPASSAVDLWGLSKQAQPQSFLIEGAVGDHPRVRLSISKGELAPLKSADQPGWHVGENGKSVVHLPPGPYTIVAEAIGHEQVVREITVTDQPEQHSIKFSAAASVVGQITAADGGPIPCKVSFYGLAGEGTKDPVFGLDSHDGAVGNTVYSADGQFVQSIPPGAYEAVISYGPEYDAVFRKINVVAGEAAPLAAKLRRVVDTRGWVSAELHSHSSPSGDNTSSQLGRVENLLCEHLEFAPCTEHQRIESYDDQLDLLGAAHLMATCSGMELTGSLLPINHQNAFPLKWKPYQQDGGGPRIDNNPITQIARLAMWDDNADKVVQTNHPNMRQMLRDKNLDGTEDGGYSKMLDYMDIIEVHPPQSIFVDPNTIDDPKQRDKDRMHPWMDLIRSGRRIPGVVNTDAHYNWHGSGWLRNWVRCSTDNPAEITVAEMTRQLEAGRIVMSTGPFMTVQLSHESLDQPAEIGDRVRLADGDAELAIKIQCPNWLDVNRVEVFVSGVIQPDLARRRSTHPDAFGDQVVKFDQRLPVKVSGDAFIIVAAIGEKMELGKVMGASFGSTPPVVVSNPIFVSAP